MTNDAQNALRRIIEKFTDNVRFCLICNYLSKIIPALQSRATRFRFGPLKEDQILPRLEHVCQEEKINITEDGKKALMTLSQGDMRRVLNILQSCAMAFDSVTEYNVYKCTGHPQKADISNVVNWALNEDFSTAYKNIQELKTNEGKVNISSFYLHFFNFRFKFTRYFDRSSLVCSSSGFAKQCQDHAAREDGGAGVKIDGGIQ